ncbi:DNA polymerase-like protein, partial [Tanacetum coccineum]
VYYSEELKFAREIGYTVIPMYAYISREDCYYTDTDSVVLSKPLPEEMISSSILGLFKLADKMAQT